MTAPTNRAARAERRPRPSRAQRHAPERTQDGAAFDILQSKLAIPSLRPGLVPRTALISRLQSSTEASVLAVIAPAGYGKTTLLAQWADGDPRPFAWVSFDKRDDDPVSFLTYIAAAMNSIHPVDASVFRAAASANDSIWARGLPRVGAAVAAMPDPFVLVLDDVHELRHHDCRDAIEPLAKHLPPGSQLVLSGRDEGGLSLARIRADRRLAEVGHADLALDDVAAHTLLNAVGVEVTEAQAAQLNLQAEGWLAGLHLAAMFMQASDDPEPISAFHGNDRFVAEYINSEHLAGLKRSERQFLTRTSVLDRLSGPLCDAVLDKSGSAARLTALEKGNFFVVSLDCNREWYRYHHLFGDMLRAELERSEPEIIPLLHRRAAAWYEENGHPEAAVDHAAAGGDVDTAARLVSGYALPFVRAGRATTVERWFGLFDDPELLRGYPAIAAFGAWVHALRGRREDAERFAHALEHSKSDGPMPDGSESPAPWSALVQAMLCRRGVAQMRADAAEALAGFSPGSYWLPPARVLHAVGVLLEGDVERGEALLRENAEASVGSGAIWAIVVTHAELALLALERSDLEECAAHLNQGDELLRNQPIEEYLPASIQFAASARLAQALGKAATARSELVSAMRMRAHFSRVDPVVRRADQARAGADPPVTCGRRRSTDAPARGRRRDPTESRPGDPAPAGRRAPRPGRECRDLRGRLGVDADGGRAPAAAAAHHAPLVPRDCGAAVRLAQHGEEPGDLGVPEARCGEPERGDRAGRRGGPRGRPGLVGDSRFHPHGVMPRTSDRSRMGPSTSWRSIKSRCAGWRFVMTATSTHCCVRTSRVPPLRGSTTARTL